MKRIINMDDSIFPPSPLKKGKKFKTHKAFKKEIEQFNLKEKNGIPLELSINAKASTGIRVPELRGLSMRRAMSTLNKKGIVSHMIGSGKVAWQNPAPGTLVQTGTICKVGLK